MGAATQCIESSLYHIKYKGKGLIYGCAGLDYTSSN